MSIDEEVERLLHKYHAKGIMLIVCTGGMESTLSCKFHPLMNAIAPEVIRRAADRLEKMIHKKGYKTLASQSRRPLLSK